VSGRSAKEIIDSATVARLKYELTYTSKSIQELSDEYNFPSQSYFCRYYKRMTGVTPSDFRKRRAEG
jgi:AraC-like DNA-binding protein